MNKMILALCILLLLGAFAAADKPVSRKYIVHLKNGGSIETNNYTVEGNRLRLELPAGQIYLDRAIVRSIEEVKGVEEAPATAVPAAPARAIPAGPPTGTKPSLPPAVRKEPQGFVDDNGHNEDWWKERVGAWKKKREDALVRYNKAE